MDNEKLRIENCQLGDLCQISPSRKPIGDDETVTFIGMEDVSGDGKIINHNLLPYSKTKNGLTYFEKNDVLVAKITPCFENGKGACLDNLKTEKGFGSTEFHILRVNNNSVPRYIFYHTQSEKFRRKLAAEMVGSAGQKRVSASAILNYQLSIVHSRSEQTAIATALNDADALITQLEKLIAKKRNIKQGAMQELLIGKKRLPGFNEKWEVKNLGDTAEVVMGQSPVGTSYNPSGIGAPLINGPTEFTEKHPIKIQWTSQPTKFCMKGDVLLCVRGSSTGRINISDDEYCIGRGIAAIRAKSGADTSFITFQVESAVKKILALTTGSTFPNIDGKSIKAIAFPIPPLPEQTAIAQVLSDMDAEIEALEKKLDKYKMLKQGMMQNLLTGRVRLI